MVVYLVWQDVDDYPEEGGGQYLDAIFQNKKDADTYCQMINPSFHNDNISYFVEEWKVL